MSFVQEDHAADGLASMAGPYDLGVFPAWHERLRTGEADE